jgi:hypothetical protein
MSKRLAATELRRRVFENQSDVEEQRIRLLKSAEGTAKWLRSYAGDALSLLHQLRFHQVGFCPLTSEPLNVIEQLNQTFTVLCSLRAVEELLVLHPDAGGFRVALGASSGRDIESVVPGLVAAEVFAATSPSSNNKLNADLKRLADDNSEHRYVFFSCPNIPKGRQEKREKYGIKVHAIQL